MLKVIPGQQFRDGEWKTILPESFSSKFLGKGRFPTSQLYFLKVAQVMLSQETRARCLSQSHLSHAIGCCAELSQWNSCQAE